MFFISLIVTKSQMQSQTNNEIIPLMSIVCVSKALYIASVFAVDICCCPKTNDCVTDSEFLRNGNRTGFHMHSGICGTRNFSPESETVVAFITL